MGWMLTREQCSWGCCYWTEIDKKRFQEVELGLQPTTERVAEWHSLRCKKSRKECSNLGTRAVEFAGACAIQKILRVHVACCGQISDGECPLHRAWFFSCVCCIVNTLLVLFFCCTVLVYVVLLINSAPSGWTLNLWRWIFEWFKINCPFHFVRVREQNYQ